MRRLLAVLVAIALVHLVARLPASAPPAFADAAATPEGFAGVIERAEPGVVTITTRLDRQPAVPRAGEASPLGSPGGGFVYSSDGLIVTSRHLVEGARTIYVDLRGRGRLEARVLAVDAEM